MPRKSQLIIIALEKVILPRAKTTIVQIKEEEQK
jgi:hypothetical protein